MRTLFVTLLVLTLFASAAIWIVSNQTGNKYGEKYRLTHIELTNKDALQDIVSTMPGGVEQSVFKQLNFDYLFMAFCFSGIAVLCFMARKRAGDITAMQKILRQPQKGKGFIKFFTILALLQILTWGLDVWENSKLEKWFANKQVGDDYGMLQVIVTIKFILALAGFITATIYLFATIKKHKSLAEKIKTNDAQKEKLVKMAA